LSTVTRLSIFDLDNTLTRRGTFSPFLLFATKRIAPWRLALVPLVFAAMLAYAVRIITRAQLKSAMHRIMIGRRVPKAKIAEITHAFAAHTLASNLYPKALALIAQEQDAGRRVMIATAACQFYSEPIAKALGVADLVATRSAWEGEFLTPEIEGSNCYGSDKLSMIGDFLKQLDLDRKELHIRFYSDHFSDLPTFDWSDEAIATNPSARLQGHAKRRKWQILSLA
jgi:HAD superfamily hydrolase (TIGR01490 family)